MRPSRYSKVIILSWHFPSGHFTNYGTLPWHYFVHRPDNLSGEDFASARFTVLLIATQVAHCWVFRKILFCSYERIRFSDSFLNALFLLCRVEMVKKWDFQIVSSALNSSRYMFWFRNLEYEAKGIKVLLLIWMTYFQ